MDYQMQQAGGLTGCAICWKFTFLESETILSLNLFALTLDTQLSSLLSRTPNF
jgi:hypothetical protein